MPTAAAAPAPNGPATSAASADGSRRPDGEEFAVRGSQRRERSQPSFLSSPRTANREPPTDGQLPPAHDLREFPGRRVRPGDDRAGRDALGLRIGGGPPHDDRGPAAGP